MKNGFLVRLWGMIDDKNLLLKSYETNNITETLKLFDYAGSDHWGHGGVQLRVQQHEGL